MNQPPTLEETQRQSRERLYPSLTNPNWLVLRERRRIFGGWLGESSGTPLDVLDVGGRLQPYRSLISDRIRNYVAVDLRLTPLVDLLARAEALPLMSDHFDLVICTQMLEYVPEPSLVLDEIHRVLKPGGRLLLSVPSASPVDAAEECWRFLPGGLRHLLAGWGRVEIVCEGGTVAGWFRTSNSCFDIFARYPAPRWIFRHTFAPLLNIAGILLEKLSRGRNQQFSVNYSVLAQK